MQMVDVLDGQRQRMSENPWVGDQILLSLSVWWVKMTRPDTTDFSTEVAVVFDSLQRDVRGETGDAATMIDSSTPRRAQRASASRQ